MLHKSQCVTLRAGKLTCLILILTIVAVVLFGLFMDNRKSEQKRNQMIMAEKALLAAKRHGNAELLEEEVLLQLPVHSDRILPPDVDRVDDQGDVLPPEAMRRLGSVRLRHGDAVTSMFFASDSRTLIAGSYDKTISCWDVESSKELWQLPAWQKIGQVTPLPDGESFVAVEQYASIFQIRRISDGKISQRLIGDSGLSESFFACSSDQRWYATTASGSNIQIWDAASGMPHRRLGDSADPARLIVFGADNISLIAITVSGKFQRWDLESWNKSSEINIGAFKSFAVSADRNSFAAVIAGKAVIWKLNVSPVPRQVPFGSSPIAFSKAGERIAGVDLNKIRVWDVAAGETVFSATLDGQYLRSLSFSPDGRLLAAGFNNGSIRIWDLVRKIEISPESGHSGVIKSLAFTQDGAGLLSVGANGELLEWDLLKGQLISSHMVASAPVILKVLDKDRALLLSYGRLVVWSLKDKAVIAQTGSGHFAGGYSRCPAAVSRDGRRAVITARSSSIKDAEPPANVLQVWDVDQMKLKMEFPSPERLAGMALSADGSCLAVTSASQAAASASADQTLIFYEVESGHERFRMAIPTRMTYTSVPMFSPNGQLIINGGSYEKGGNVIKIASSGEKIYFPSCVGTFAGQEQIGPDGKLIAKPAWGDSSLVQVELGKGSGRVLKGHRGRVSAVAFSPGGRYLATGGQDSTILLWDLNAGESFTENVAPASQNVETTPEALLNASPFLVLSFEGSIGTDPLALTSLADGLSGRAFVDGKEGLALSLSAAEHRPIVLEEGEDILLPPCWTVQFWFMLDHNPAEESLAYMEVFDCDLFSFVINKSGRATLFYQLQNRSGHGSVSLLKNHAPAVGRWYHLAVAWEGPKGNLRVQLDGATVMDSPQAGLGSVIGPMSFGRAIGKSPANRVLIDELKIYKHARRPEEVAQEVGYIEDPNQ
ncbi:MAG: hypothetical protein KKB51_08250 [Candidatus Riflebacteria bacterium]|nr:hypothetical protein [Candidatus Riflebacteria bacterium]